MGELPWASFAYYCFCIGKDYFFKENVMQPTKNHDGCLKTLVKNHNPPPINVGGYILFELVKGPI